VQTLSCTIRKTTRAAGESARMLSRIHYMRPDKIHIENTAPSVRRIVADGTTLYYHEKGVRRGFSRPITDLDDDWLLSLRIVPGTPGEHLSKLAELEETALPATPAFPVRRGYTAPKNYVVMSCDSTGRVAKIEFFTTAACDKLQASFTYEDFFEVAGDCWIPRLHKALQILPDGSRIEETRHVDNLQVNAPVPEHLFNPELFFKDIEFVKTFEDTWK